MKKIQHILCLSALLTIMCGCNSFLEVENIGKSTIESFFSDMTGFRAATTGLHRTLYDFYDSRFLRYGDITADMTDILSLNADEDQIKLHNFTMLSEDDSYSTRTIWRDGYVVVTNANNIIYFSESLLKKFPGYAEEIHRSVAQAQFARALATFNLCQVYGQNYHFTSDASHLGVPYVDWVPGFDDVIARDQVSRVYSMAIADLKSAAEVLGTDAIEDVHYISGLACEALLARIYLYMEDFENAALYSAKLIQKFSLSPREEYEDMFRKAYSTPGTETILRLNGYGAGTSMKSLFDPTLTQKLRPSAKLVALFTDPSDIRLKMLTYIGEDNEAEFAGKTFSTSTKYCAYKSISDEKNRCYDPFVLRLSEMYLIHAEALCRQANPQLQQAAEDIRALMARATGRKASEIQLSYSNATDLDRIIANERARELCFEGHRFFDITRRHEDLVRGASSSSSVLSMSYPDDRMVLPICSTEMEANEKMIQNPGYTGRQQ